MDGEWCWTPYAAYRPRRSWWQPALVVVTWSGNLICWYPLPYSYGYYNYNSHYHHNHHNNNNNNNTGGNPTPTPNAVPVPLPGKGPKLPPLESVPPTAVVTIAKEQFGNQIKGAKTAPLDVAKMVLSKEPDVVKQAPELPVGIVKTTAVKNEIIIEKPRVKSEPIARTGVVERKIGVPMDAEIRQKKVFEDRKPVERQRDLSGGEKPVRGTIDGGNTEIRKTGAVERSPVRPVVRQDDDNTDNQTPPTETPVRPPRDKTRDDDQPVVKPRREENQLPVYVPPPPPREEPRERPRQEPPVRQEPRNERPREEPRREEPKPEPPRQEQPKSEPKPESKPQPPSEVKGNKNGKDGLN